MGYDFNVSYTLSKTFDYSDDDQLENGNKDEQVNLVEGTAGLRKEKGYALTDERHRMTVYGEATLPWASASRHCTRSVRAFPRTRFCQAAGARLALPMLPRNALGREIKNSDQLNSVIDRWNALPACPEPIRATPEDRSPMFLEGSTSSVLSALSICACAKISSCEKGSHSA